MKLVLFIVFYLFILLLYIKCLYYNLVTGNEIIKGQVLDTNTQFLCKGLYDCGIKVARVMLLPELTTLFNSLI